MKSLKLPKNLRIFLQKGRELYNSGKKEEALTELLKIPANKKFHVPTYYLIGVIYSEFDKREEAVKYLDPIIKKGGPYRVWAYSLKGKIHEKNGEIDKAELCYEKAFQGSPDYAPFLDQLIELKKRTNKLASIERILRYHIPFDVRNIKKWELLLQIYEQKKDQHNIEVCRTNIERLKALGI